MSPRYGGGISSLLNRGGGPWKNRGLVKGDRNFSISAIAWSACGGMGGTSSDGTSEKRTCLEEDADLGVYNA